MKAKDVAEILLKYPDMEVEIGVYAYQNFHDSVGAYDFSGVTTVSVRKKTKFCDAKLVLTEGKIGYPDCAEDFDVIEGI